MVQFNLLVVFVGIIFSLFLTGVYWSYHRFYDRLNPLKHWDITSLASAKRVSLESSQLISALQVSYKISIENFKAGQNSSDEINSRNLLIDNFAVKLASSLNNTLNQGLNFNDSSGRSDSKKYQDFSYSLIHSNYLPEAVSGSSKKYNSTLITEDKINSNIEVANITSINESGKTIVSENLLKTLVGDEGTNIIKSNPDFFGTLVRNDGLDLEQLPNGLKLNVRFDSDLDEKKTKLSEKQIISAGQIRIENIPDPSSIQNPEPLSPEPTTPSPELFSPEPITLNPKPFIPEPSAPSPEPVIQEIEFSLIPADKRAIVYDPTKPIDKNNPIRIINTKEGGYSILYLGDDGYINIGIGDAKVNNVNVIKTTLSPSTSFSSATLNLVGDNDNASLSNNSGYSIKMDTIPRGQKRYTTVDQSFVVNGITIPQGFIIIGTKEPGTGGRPGVEKFENFRVYDPQSGALITYFGQNALAKANGSKGQYFSFDKFYTAPGTKHMGADLYETFSISQLFTNASPSIANQLWINIQGDLERDTKLNINSSNEPWQERILKDLNDDEMVYLGHALRYESPARVREIFGFANVSYKDDYARQLDDAQFAALKDYALAKINYWNKDIDPLKDLQELNQLKQTRERTKVLYEQSRLEYNNYIKYNTLPDWLKPKVTTTQANTNQQSNSNSQTSSNTSSQSNNNTNNSANQNKDDDSKKNKNNNGKKKK